MLLLRLLLWSGVLGVPFSSSRGWKRSLLRRLILCFFQDAKKLGKMLSFCLVPGVGAFLALLVDPSLLILVLLFVHTHTHKSASYYGTLLYSLALLEKMFFFSFSSRFLVSFYASIIDVVVVHKKQRTTHSLPPMTSSNARCHVECDCD